MVSIMGYKILTDATADLSTEMMAGLPEVEVIPMEITVGDDRYLYGTSDGLDAEQFYELQRSGKYASTAQIPPYVYYEFFKKYLEQGLDVLYLSFSSGLSGTFQSSQIAMNELREYYPERKIVSLDTKGASIGEALLVREAARKQGEGMSVMDLKQWILAHRLEACHWFTVDQLEHLKHGGRISPATAAIGTMLQIKPLLHVDREGVLTVVEKPRGRKKSIECQLSRMEKGWNPGFSREVIVAHGGNLPLAEQLKSAVAARFPEAQIYVAEIGPVIGAHTGPDMLALSYWGTNR